MNTRRGWRRWLAAVLLAALAACDSDPAPESDAHAPAALPLPSHRQAGLPDFNAYYDETGSARMGQLVRRSADLCSTVGVMLSAPEPSNFDLVRERWRSAHDAYLAAVPFVAAVEAGPAYAAAATPPSEYIDAWPMLAGYIDYTADHPRSGIVFDTTVSIEPAGLIDQHQLTDASEVSIGFHAMEFLLWGEDGGRPLADFETNAEGEEVQRRRLYLAALCRLLETQVRQVATAWDSMLDASRVAGSVADQHELRKRLSGLRAIIRTELLKRRLEALQGTSDPDLECAFGGPPLCGLAALGSTLQTLYVGDAGNTPRRDLAGLAAAIDPQLGSGLEHTVHDALESLYKLAYPDQLGALSQSIASLQGWASETRTLQQAMSGATGAAADGGR